VVVGTRSRAVRGDHPERAVENAEDPAAEFSSGTLRSVLLRDRHGLRVIVGRLGGALIVAARISES
jgi:hypothetical protein